MAARSSGARSTSSKPPSAESLASYKKPKKVFLVDALPRNAMGKVQKNLLRERYSGSFAKS